jgi:FlaG/FlaF family flagellin (archaellin)
MKGISTIIAEIIMVVITIGLISVAYLYMSGLLTATTAQSIALLDAYCESTDKNITVLIKNDGTSPINTTAIKWYVDGSDKSLNVYPNDAGTSSCYNSAVTLGAGSSKSCIICGKNVAGCANLQTGSRELRIIGPSNAVGGTVSC